ncbi:alpha/beta fold hydrolase [Streptomyces bambusae]|nr:alpha/beta fold hydrolase [Streptomyces bambusae]
MPPRALRLPRPPRRLRTAFAAGLCAAVLLQPTAAATPRENGSGTPSTAVRWQECRAIVGIPVDPAVADCAVHHVPRDYARPAEGTVPLVMLRRRASDPARRTGTLFVNPGGPGTSGLHTAYRAERFLDPEVLARHDVIGFDPRGVNTSAALKCYLSQEDYAAGAADRVPVPVADSEIARTLRATAAYTDACARNAGPLLPHATTLNAARDLDQLRRSTGDERLGYIGFSYGTLLGATYANLYPDRVGSMVLDGNVDPVLRSSDGLEYDRRRAAGTELALAEYLRRCAAAPAVCPFAGSDTRQKFDRIRDRLRTGPLTLPDGTTTTLSRFTAKVADSLATPSRHTELAGTLAELHQAVAAEPAAPAAQASEGARVIEAAEASVQAGTPYRRDDSETAYNCLDKPYPPTPALWPVLAAHWEGQSPTFGRMAAFESLPCATWPARWWQADRYAGPWSRPTPRPVLVIGNRYDPTTRYRFAERMATVLGSARLVSVDMIGHTALGLSRCADAITTDYLLGRADPPPGGAECRPDTESF